MLEDAPNRLFVSREKGKYTHKAFVALKRGIGCTSPDMGVLFPPSFPSGVPPPLGKRGLSSIMGVLITPFLRVSPEIVPP